MAKRRADKELTDRNWDEEDESEEPGEIEIASAETLKTRNIIKGKRRGVAGTGVQSQNKEFSGFSGFSFKPTTTSTPFSFNVKSFTNGSVTKDEKASENQKTELENGQKDNAPTSNGADKKKSYLSNLKTLNESVLAWIKSHVEKNPYCILTPVFKDYDKHLADIMKGKEDSSKTDISETKSQEETKESKPSFPVLNSSNTSEVKSAAATFSFGTSTTKTSTEAKPSAPSFAFGSSGTLATAGSTESKPIGSGFSFGSSTTATGFPGFNFKPQTDSTPAATGFSFGVNKPKEDAGSQEEDDEYVPPKAESTEIPEDGSLYSVKCKLFYQHEGKWKEKGVGFLHLKRPEEKLQLVVRADTTLGNILLNIILSKSIPLARQGKNNVSLMCVPNPPIKDLDDSKPVPMLMRVKTGEDADKLLEKMEELRKQD